MDFNFGKITPPPSRQLPPSIFQDFCSNVFNRRVRKRAEVTKCGGAAFHKLSPSATPRNTSSPCLHSHPFASLLSLFPSFFPRFVQAFFYFLSFLRSFLPQSALLRCRLNVIQVLTYLPIFLPDLQWHKHKQNVNQMQAACSAEGSGAYQ